MFQTSPNLAKYTPNRSHLHGCYANSKSHIPSKMQSLDSNVVNKFLTTINGDENKKCGKTLDNSNIVWDPQTGEPIRPTTQKPPIHPKTTKNATEEPLDWRKKFEESEKKRKELLSESQKAGREKISLEKRLKTIEEDYLNLKNDYLEKTQQLAKLSHVSEKVYQDYDKLNNKYEVETKALHRALGAASKWYQENQKLRRESIARSSLDPALNLDEVDNEGQDELEELRKTVKDLSQQIGTLQSTINRLKHQECEFNEQICSLNGLLGEERQKNQQQQKELKELRLLKEKFESVSVMVHGEVEALRLERDRAAEKAHKFMAEAQEAKKERNVLAHQSSLLMGDISTEDKFFKLLLEVEELKRRLEEEEQKHAAEIAILHERLEARSTDDQVEFLEEKLKLAENDLQLALERAVRAEELNKTMVSANNGEEKQIPRPPAPPPPPPMPGLLTAVNPGIKKPVQKSVFNEGDSLEDMAKLLGIQRSPKPVVPNQPGAIDELINEIKGGKFTLKATEKQKSKKEEPPAAVQEMLSIIGTLKRTNHRGPTSKQLLV